MFIESNETIVENKNTAGNKIPFDFGRYSIFTLQYNLKKSIRL